MRTDFSSGPDQNAFSMYATTNSTMLDCKLPEMLAGAVKKPARGPSGFSNNTPPQLTVKQDGELPRKVTTHPQKDPAEFRGPHRKHIAQSPPGRTAHQTLAIMHEIAKTRTAEGCNRSTAFQARGDVIRQQPRDEPHHCLTATFPEHKLIDPDLPAGCQLPSPQERMRKVANGSITNRQSTALYRPVADPDHYGRTSLGSPFERPVMPWKNNPEGHGAGRGLNRQWFAPTLPHQPLPLRRPAVRRMRKLYAPNDDPSVEFKPTRTFDGRSPPAEAFVGSRGPGASKRAAIEQCTRAKPFAPPWTTDKTPGCMATNDERPVLQPVRLTGPQAARLVSRRLENEAGGEIIMSMYQSSFVNQNLQPEQPVQRARQQIGTGYRIERLNPLGLGLAADGIVAEQKSSPPAHPAVLRKVIAHDPGSVRTGILARAA
eukprot:TRINITY_DN71035_c0_g1_i1.p1 TRINITY_DN71035_c0_g1~~TRINITY_DN71035_c0_g1_i1.p1  ORF type:complete len:457 (+),score=128.81 TRINITY_DN71035_c0_g1_i1:84-1373(+)